MGNPLSIWSSLPGCPPPLSPHLKRPLVPWNFHIGLNQLLHNLNILLVVSAPWPQLLHHYILVSNIPFSFLVIFSLANFSIKSHGTITTFPCSPKSPVILPPIAPPLTSPRGPCRMILLCMALVCKVPISTWRTRWYRWELYTQEPCRVRSSFNPPPFLLHPNLLHKRYTLFFITSFWLIPLIPLILPLSHHLLSFNPLLLFIFALPPNSDIRHPWMKLKTLSIYCVPLHFKVLHCICGNRTARLTKQL